MAGITEHHHDEDLRDELHVDEDVLIERVEAKYTVDSRLRLIQYGPSLRTTFMVPLHHILSVMMGPLYYDVHLPLLERWLQYTELLIINVTNDGRRSVMFNPLFYRKSLNENTATDDRSLADVSRLNVSFLKLLTAMLRRQRINEEQDLLRGRRSLQDVYDSHFMSNLFVESRLPNMPYLQAIDFLRTWRDLLQEDHCDRRIQ